MSESVSLFELDYFLLVKIVILGAGEIARR